MNNKFLSIENARIIKRNFSGRDNIFNKNSSKKRSFCVCIDDEEQANALRSEGWNVREKDIDDNNKMYFIPVAITFDNYPPKVVMITNGRKVLLNESNIGNLDYAEIEYIDLVLRARVWEMGGKSGIKAYLKAIYVTVQEDMFAEKYASYDGDNNLPWN